MPVEPLHESEEVTVGGIVTLVGVKVQVRPVGATELVRATVPEKAPLAATVMVEVAEVPEFTITLVGLALRLMPGGGPEGLIVTPTFVEFVISLLVPPVPAIVTV